MTPAVTPRLSIRDLDLARKRLFLRADKAVPYGELMRLMDALRAAGYLKVALVGLEGPPGQSGATGAPPVASPQPNPSGATP